MKILIYEAGNYCDLYLSKLKKDKDIILGIVDRNCNKWGLEKDGYRIKPPDIMSQIQYDMLIIAVKDWEPVLDQMLKSEMNISYLFIYSGERNELYAFSYLYNKYLEYKRYRRSAVKQIKVGLLTESFNYGEYSGFERIIVIGEKEDYSIVKEYFYEISENKKIINYTENMEINRNDKVILCGKDYKRNLKNIREKIDTDKQWIILPFFDIEATVILKGVLE